MLILNVLQFWKTSIENCANDQIFVKHFLSVSTYFSHVFFLLSWCFLEHCLAYYRKRVLQTGSKFCPLVLFLKSPEKFIRITNVYSSFSSGIVRKFSLRKLRKVPTNYRHTEISALWRCFSIFQRLDNSFEIYLKLFSWRSICERDLYNSDVFKFILILSS